MNKKIELGWRRKTKVMKVPYSRRGFWAIMVVLVSCLSLFCTDAGAVYQIINSGDSYVYGLTGGAYTGSDFGNESQPGWVIAIASDYEAYGVVTFEGSLEIDGEFSSGADIEAYAGISYAYGLYSEGGSITTDALNGEIRVATGQKWAVGLYSYNGSITTGDIGGTITATAGWDYAFGLYNLYGDITTGAITGTITAKAGEYVAYGLYSGSDMIIGGNIGSTAEITATAEYGYAYGLLSFGSLTTHGINGVITAEATYGSDAYGLYSASDMTIGNIGYDADIAATAYDSYAYGLFSYGALTTGDINGTIAAEATYGSDAYGLYSGSGMIIGDIGSNAEIAATAYDGFDTAAGLYSEGSLNIDEINGYIAAEVTEGSSAYGMSATSDLTVGDIGYDAFISAMAGVYHAHGLYSSDGNITTGTIDGTITAFAGDAGAAGLYAPSGSIETGDINGTITVSTNDFCAWAIDAGFDLIIDSIGSDANINATAGSISARGLGSDSGSIYTGAINGEITVWAGMTDAIGLLGNEVTTGDISGAITVAAGGDWAYGFRSYGLINIYGDISGTITAIAGGDQAVGLYSEDWVNIDAISGTIYADAGYDYAYGILSYGPMDVFIDGGEVNAIANYGTHVAAIQSGRIGEEGLDTQEADDTVEIAAGSTIVGNIDLAETTDNDMLTLSGVNLNSTTLADDILNIEDINITGGRWFINGTVSGNAYGIVVSGGILSGTGWLEDVYVAGGTLNPGNRIGTINIDGDLNFSPGGVFEVEFNNSEEADLAVVTGSAALEGGTVRVKALEGIDHSFAVTVINANSLSGEFSTIEGGTAFLISVDYEDNNVILNIEPNLFVSIECDFDSNREVNFEDIVRLVDQWLWVGQAGGITEDIVQDGTVNFLDYCVCAENWLKEYPVKFYSNHLDSDPGWTTEGEWAYGQPMGGGGAMYGNPDPTSGCTGLNVYGVNLNGDYNLAVTGEAYYLTAGPFNCTQYSDVRLVFARWLNTDYPPYVSNTIEVSNNGNDWQIVWQYPGTEPLEDSVWQTVEYDISQIADGSSAVYVRWGYETHDRAYPYSGWNIDEISLWGNPAVE